MFKQLLARYDRIEKSTLVELELHGLNLASRRWCGENNNFLKIYKPRKFENVVRLLNGQTSNFGYPLLAVPPEEWVLVYESDRVSKNKLANWPIFTLQKSKLCSMKPEMPLKFEVFDYKTNMGNHNLVGGAILTYNQLKGGAGTWMDIFDARSKIGGRLAIKTYSESRFYFN